MILYIYRCGLKKADWKQTWTLVESKHWLKIEPLFGGIEPIHVKHMEPKRPQTLCGPGAWRGLWRGSSRTRTSTSTSSWIDTNTTILPSTTTSLWGESEALLTSTTHLRCGSQGWVLDANAFWKAIGARSSEPGRPKISWRTTCAPGCLSSLWCECVKQVFGKFRNSCTSTCNGWNNTWADG